MIVFEIMIFKMNLIWHILGIGFQYALAKKWPLCMSTYNQDFNDSMSYVMRNIIRTLIYWKRSSVWKF